MFTTKQGRHDLQGLDLTWIAWSGLEWPGIDEARAMQVLGNSPLTAACTPDEKDWGKNVSKFTGSHQHSQLEWHGL